MTAELERREAGARADLEGEDVELMLCETSDEPFTQAGWLFELKLDG